MKENKKTVGGVLKEACRKFMVALKRRPQMIALVVVVVAFLYYSLNLMYISDTTARIQGPGMGFTGFCTMLFSMLSFMCFINAFPYRKPVNKVMLVLMFIMFAIIIGCDAYYSRMILNAVTRAENRIEITSQTAYIAKAYNMLRGHMVILGIGVVLVILLPVYSKLLRKIKTSIEVEGNGEMGAIDLSND